MTLEKLQELSHFPHYTGPHLHNPDNVAYYSFLFYLASAVHSEVQRPLKILEIGTDKGDSACYLSAGAPDSVVLTIDQADSPTLRERLGYFPMVTFLHDNVNRVPGLPAELAGQAPFDILFQDGEHSGMQVKGEHQWYLPLLRPGGVLVMDDISLPDCGIREVWDAFPWAKVELPHLHTTGFGVAIKPGDPDYELGN